MSYVTSYCVRFAYFLEASARYHRVKEFCRMLLEHQHSKLKFYFDIFMVALVLISVLFLLYEVKHPDGHPFLDAFVQFSLVVFIIEYLLRFWIYSDSHKLFLEHYEYAINNNLPFSLPQTLLALVKKKVEYILSPLAIIDLLAILPSYRPLRFLRIFLLFRIFKLFRYARSMKTFTSIITEKKFELFTLAIFASFVIFTGSSAIYIFETHQNPKINTLFDALYWAIVTMGTVGYGDIVPVTTEGMVVAMILIILGVATLAFLTSIIVSSFQNKLIELKESRTFADVDKLESYIVICGYGRVGEVVAKMLHEDGYKLVIIDNDETKIKLAQQRGLIGIVADASKSRILGELGVGKRAAQIICATNSDELNVFITLTARSLSEQIIIIARVIKNTHKKKYFLAGANYAFSADETIGLMGAQYITQPISYAALDEMLTENTGVLFDMVPIHEHAFFINQPIAALNLSEKRLLLFGILRQNSVLAFEFNPSPHCLLQLHDTLIIMGRKHHINLLRKHNDQGNMG
ncbi:MULTISPECIES: potassium channel protein [unclassified Sulfurospirillum]|uniref:potassium channel protein n=1 Tax=unclassified Sulfurospirillum TaxID=2618290 RepID=UPI0025F78CAB|nr:MULTISPECIES: potassium channel protein [unclassified Sulfurospirillum]